MSDLRSSLTVKIINASPCAYEALTVAGDTPALARDLLEGVKPGQLLSAPGASSAAADAMLAGLWLWHDGLDESHKISQSIESPTGSFWHAIMHRREGDFSNSKYWYAKTAGHPVLTLLANQAGTVVNQLPSDRQIMKIVASGWNSAAFVDFVEAVHDKPGDPRHQTAVLLQQLEWRTLFDFCRGAETSNARAD